MFDSTKKKYVSDQLFALDERINLRPATVLDAGCAMGFLVEWLRKYDIAAEGVDISEYAIQKAHESVKPYVRVGSITEPFV